MNANVILRGLRAVSDFEYEFQMALINRRLNRDIETVFLMTGYQWFYTSSNLIKEAASLGGSVKGLVPDIVNERLEHIFIKAKE
jgi:pantetheine-phosphate adenylyltransferase